MRKFLFTVSISTSLILLGFLADTHKIFAAITPIDLGSVNTAGDSLAPVVVGGTNVNSNTNSTNQLNVNQGSSGNLIGSSVSAPTVAPSDASTGTQDEPQFTCWTLTGGLDVRQCAAEGIYYIILTPLGWVLWAAGEILDLSINVSIYQMNAFINGGANGGIVFTTWGIFRDIANLFFIAILIYVSVITVLGLGDWKKMITNVIITALIINFSLFFTEVIIDASNIFTLQFYEKINTVQSNSTATGNGISAAIMNPLKLTLIYNNQSTGNYSSVTTPGSLSGLAQAGAVQTDKLGAMITTMLLGSLMILITSFVFLAAAILFVTRFIILIALMIFSPLAFAGIALPKINSLITKKWWDSLIDQCIFAPTFMVMVWVTVRIINSSSFSQFLQSGGGSPALSIDTITTGGSQTITLILNFAIVIGFMILSLVVAKMLGAKGADFAVEKAGAATIGIAASLGRNTFGKAADSLAKSEFYKNRIATIPIVGRVGKAGLEKVGGASFDVRNRLSAIPGAPLGKATGKGGFAAEEKKRVESEEKFSKYLGEGAGGKERQEKYVQQSVREGTTGLLPTVRRDKDTGKLVFKPFGKSLLNSLVGRTNAVAKTSAKVRTELDKKNADDFKAYATSPRLVTEKAALEAVPEIAVKKQHDDEIKELQKQIAQFERDISDMIARGASQNRLDAIRKDMNKVNTELQQKQTDYNESILGPAALSQNPQLLDKIKRLDYINELQKSADKAKKQKDKEENLKVISDQLKEGEEKPEKKEEGGGGEEKKEEKH